MNFLYQYRMSSTRYVLCEVLESLHSHRKKYIVTCAQIPGTTFIIDETFLRTLTIKVNLKKGRNNNKRKLENDNANAEPASQPAPPASFNGMEAWPGDSQAMPLHGYDGPLTNNQCAYCKQEGHWKNDCPNRQWDGWKTVDWY